MSQSLTPQSFTPQAEPPKYAVSSVMNQELEATMLGQLLVDKHALMRVVHLLSEDCFTLPAHRTLYKAVVELDVAGLEVSSTSVVEHLRAKLTPDRAGYIVAEAASVFGQHDELPPDYMAAHLVEYAKRRHLASVSEKIMRLNSDMTYPLEQGIHEVQELFERIVFGQRDSFLTLSESLTHLASIIADNQDDQKRHNGLTCGLKEIDQQGGLPADGVVVIGAKASHGKTTLATNVAISALKSGKKIAFYSMEMSIEKVTGRIVAMECGVSSNALLRQRLLYHDQQRALRCIERLRESEGKQFFFDNRSVRDLDSLILSIRALKKAHGLDCVVVDYLQLMNESPGQRSENTNKLFGGIAHRLHEVAQDLHITILLLSQINRQVQGEPTMANLRDSGEIAEAADMVIIVYNADFEHTTLPRPYDNVPPAGKLLIKVEKNRDGATQSFLVGFDPVATRISPLVASGEVIEPQLFNYQDS